MKHNSNQTHDRISESELIINPDGSIFHLHLLPEDLAKTVILVGDPNRVPKISKYFDSIELKKTNREFLAHTGYIGSKRLTVLSTGMGSENIDIVMNELDALVNIDFTTRTRKAMREKLSLIRLGTCGGLQQETPLGSIIVSDMAFGLNSLMSFYDYPYSDLEQQAIEAFKQYYPDFCDRVSVFSIQGSTRLVEQLSPIGMLGYTVTCPGFYGPQGRVLNAPTAFPDFFDKLAEFRLNAKALHNFEMETAAIYGLGKLLGHECCSVSTLIVQRNVKQFVPDLAAVVENMIQVALEKIADK